jgi:site-specific DNA-methyltransferase (adenine-specific)
MRLPRRHAHPLDPDRPAAAIGAPCGARAAPGRLARARERSLRRHAPPGGAATARRPPVAGLENSDFLAEPVWRTPGETHRPRHRHAGPPEVFRRLLALYSRPGDLVVDPFCGGGGVLAVAQAMGRDAIGYDIDPGAVALARRRLEP